MLYFKFNTDNFKPPIREMQVTSYKNGEPVGTRTEQEELKLGDIDHYFFDELKKQTGICIFGTGGALDYLLGIPPLSFCIDDERGDSDFSLMAQYIIANFSKVPIYDGKSIEDLGIKIEFIKRVSNKEVNETFRSYMDGNHLQYLAEEILWKNMTDDEKAGKFNEYLAKIEVRGKELIIIDPYLFNDDSDDYCNLITKIFKMSHCQKITVITDMRAGHYKGGSFTKIESELNTAPYFVSNEMLLEHKDETSSTPIPIEVKDSNEFHDRFWIADRKKGFNVGTSFNGIGKKISSINFTFDEDVADIINELQRSGLI